MIQEYINSALLYDGDTINVQIDSNVYRIRLLSVNCPETTAEKIKSLLRKFLITKRLLVGLDGYYGRYSATEGTFRRESEYLKLENYTKTKRIGLCAYYVVIKLAIPSHSQT